LWSLGAGVLGQGLTQEVRDWIARVIPTLWGHFWEELQIVSNRPSFAFAAEVGLQGSQISKFKPAKILSKFLTRILNINFHNFLSTKGGVLRLIFSLDDVELLGIE